MSEPYIYTVNDQLPGLYIPSPQCGHCGSDVQIEDGRASCSNCRIVWDEVAEDADAEPNPNIEGTDVPCGVVAGRRWGLTPITDGGKTYTYGESQPCILPSGHEGDEHLCPVEVTVTEV